MREIAIECVLSDAGQHQGIEKCSKRNGDMYWLHYGPLRPGAADLSGPRVPQASR